MSDIATTTDAKLMEGPAFVRATPLAPLPPPLTEAGAIGWLRKNLFSGPLNIALTILCALLIVWIVPPLVKFLVIDAVWDGAEPRRLPGQARPSGDGRLLGLRHRQASASSPTASIRSTSAGGSTCSSCCWRSASSGWPGSTRRAAISA